MRYNHHGVCCGGPVCASSVQCDARRTLDIGGEQQRTETKSLYKRIVRIASWATAISGWLLVCALCSAGPPPLDRWWWPVSGAEAELSPLAERVNERVVFIRHKLQIEFYCNKGTSLCSIPFPIAHVLLRPSIGAPSPACIRPRIQSLNTPKNGRGCLEILLLLTTIYLLYSVSACVGRCWRIN